MIKSIRKLVSEYWYKYVPYKVTVTSVNTWKVSARDNKVLIDKHTSRKRWPARRYPARLDHALAMLDRIAGGYYAESRGSDGVVTRTGGEWRRATREACFVGIFTCVCDNLMRGYSRDAVLLDLAVAMVAECGMPRGSVYRALYQYSPGLRHAFADRINAREFEDIPVWMLQDIIDNPEPITVLFID